MQLLPLDRLGPHELPGNQLQFGFLLPWVSSANGNRLFVKLIHEDDQFLQQVPRAGSSCTTALIPYTPMAVS